MTNTDTTEPTEPATDPIQPDEPIKADTEGDADDSHAVGVSVAPPTAEGPRHCGLIAIVGKPNVGKSTLLNALVGQKISITSRKAQTTRHRITGMRTVGATQFVFVDTPGFQTLHANALNKSLNKTVLGAVADARGIETVYALCAYLPLLGVITVLLPDTRRPGGADHV